VQHEAALPPLLFEQQQQQQQPARWPDKLHLPQLLRKRAPSQGQQQQQQQAPPADPAGGCEAVVPAAEPGNSSRWKARRMRLLQLLDSPGTSWLLMVMTLFVIFQEDVKYALLPPSADLGLEAVTLALLLLFLIEIGAG
jgi:hypothetical protein